MRECRQRFLFELTALSALPIFTLQERVRVELDIRKSRFIGMAIPVADRDAAIAELDALRSTYSDATHVCWALLAAGHSGMSDDGEPSGTAGRPILEVLRHHDVDGVLGVVIRYYGGIKLGAGGLVRAYTDAIASAMQIATRIERIAQADLRVDLDYPDEARIRHWIEQNGYALVDVAYAMRLTMTIRLPASEAQDAHDALRNMTSARAQVSGP